MTLDVRQVYTLGHYRETGGFPNLHHLLIRAVVHVGVLRSLVQLDEYQPETMYQL